MPKDFVCLADWPAQELWAMLDRARELKQLDRAGQRPQTLQGCALAMFFEKPSLRTHVTFEAGMTQLGGNAILLRPEQVGIGTRESAADVARNLSRWVDGLVARTFSHTVVEELAEAATIPVINGLTDLLHPCQVMADFQTVAERVPLKDAAIAYVGDGFNMAHSLMLGAATLGLELRVATPTSHRPSPRIRKRAEALAAASGARLGWSEDPREAVAGCDIVYTDVWTSMGQEEESARRRQLFAPYQVNAALLAGAPDAWVMHCLPAHRGEEITDEVLDGERSIVLDQAENRLHAQKAILERLLGPER
ncbi:MAG: ornithine carbamoyltransferase [Deltaproteobacteria bacterium]|nr:ornithine carbamoyltransferase [Deltaproteobacteria bacterium]MBW2360341.1 ornithine carbamoyltransferase [Deltaproteobacteria bacterium]